MAASVSSGAMHYRSPTTLRADLPFPPSPQPCWAADLSSLTSGKGRAALPAVQACSRLKASLCH